MPTAFLPPFTSADSTKKITATWRLATSAVHNLSKQCSGPQDVLREQPTLSHATRWLVQMCGCSSIQTLSKRLYANSQKEFLLLTVVGQMLKKLLSLPHSSPLWQHKPFHQAFADLLSLLRTFLLLEVPGKVDSPVQTVLGLQLAKKLQEAGFIDPLAEAMQHISEVIASQGSQSSTVDRTCEAASSQTLAHHAPGKSKQALEFDCCCNPETSVVLSLLPLAIRICTLWPGNVFKSSAARPLLPATVKLAEAAALLANYSHLHRNGDANVQNQAADFAKDLMDEAVTAAHILVGLYHTSAADLSLIFVMNAVEADAKEYMVLRCHSYDNLMILLTAALAQLCLPPCTAEPLQPGQQKVNSHHLKLQQRLQEHFWWRLTTNADLLLFAADSLQRSLGQRAVNSSSQVSMQSSRLPTIELFTKLTQQLDQCWCSRTYKLTRHFEKQCDGNLSKVAPMLKLVEQGFQMKTFIMEVADMLYATGIPGVKGDLQPLTAVMFRSESLWRHLRKAMIDWNSCAQHTDTASLQYPVSNLLGMLLRFLQRALTAASRHEQAAAASTSSLTAPVTDDLAETTSLWMTEINIKMLLEQLLHALDNLLDFSVEYHTDNAVVAAWSAYDGPAAAVVEAGLRGAAQQGHICADDIATITTSFERAAVKMLGLYDFPHPVHLVLQCNQCTAVTGTTAAALPSDTNRNLVASSLPSDANTRPATIQQAIPPKLRVFALMSSYHKLLLHRIGKLSTGTRPTIEDHTAGVRLASLAGQVVRQYLRQQQDMQLAVEAVVLRPWLSLLGRGLIAVGSLLQLELEWCRHLQSLEQELLQLCKDVAGIDQQDSRKPASAAAQAIGLPALQHMLELFKLGAAATLAHKPGTVELKEALGLTDDSISDAADTVTAVLQQNIDRMQEHPPTEPLKEQKTALQLKMKKAQEEIDSSDSRKFLGVAGEVTERIIGLAGVLVTVMDPEGPCKLAWRQPQSVSQNSRCSAGSERIQCIQTAITGQLLPAVLVVDDLNLACAAGAWGADGTQSFGSSREYTAADLAHSMLQKPNKLSWMSENGKVTVSCSSLQELLCCEQWLMAGTVQLQAVQGC